MPAIRHDDVLLRLVKDVSYIRSILNRVTVNLPLFDVANENTPSQLTGDQDNYTIGNYDLLRLSSSQAVTITGLKGGIKGRFLRIFNVGDYPITLSYQDASSNIENRFKFSNGQDAPIPPSSNITVYYDRIEERWIGGDVYSSGAVFAGITDNTFQSIPSGALTKMTFNASVFDQYGFFDDGNDRLVIPFPGFYNVSLNAVFSGVGAALGYPRFLYIIHYDSVGVAVRSNIGYATQDYAAGVSAINVFLGDNYDTDEYVEFSAYQVSPAAASLSLASANAIIQRLS